MFKFIKKNVFPGFRLKTVIIVALIGAMLLSLGSSATAIIARINKMNRENSATVSERIASQLEIVCNRRLSQYMILQRSIEHYVEQGNLSVPDITNEFLSRLLQANPDVESILVYDKDGHIWYHASSSFKRLTETPNIPLRYRSSLFLQKGFHEPTVLDIFENQEEWVVPYVTPHTPYKLPPYYIMINVRQSAFMNLLDETLIGQNGYSYLISDSGTTIAHPKQQYLYWGVESDETFDIALNHRSGTFHAQTDGQVQLVIIHPVSGTTWKLVCVAYSDDILPWKSVYLDILSVLLLSVLLITALALGISHCVSRPILRLQESMVMLENGNLDTDMPLTGYYETRELAQTFNQMRRRIKKLLKKVQTEEEEKRKQELYALRMQIQPHFLYNTLESLTWMIENGRGGEAVSMINSMSRLFRITLSQNEAVIPLTMELEHVRSYLEIQQFRFEENFSYSFDISEAASRCQIPKLTLQPIVENALYHGIAPIHEPGSIHIHAAVDGDLLEVCIEDNGFGMSPEVIETLLRDTPKADGSGVGLSNINRRIKLLYDSDERYGIHIQSEIDVGTKVMLVLPVQERNSNEAE